MPSRLPRAQDDLRQLVAAVIEGRHLTLAELSDVAGLSTNVIKGYLGTLKKTRPPTTLSVAEFPRLLAVFQENDIRLRLSLTQRDKLTRIVGIFASSTTPMVRWLTKADAFRSPPIDDLVVGHYLCFRLSATTDRIAVSATAISSSHGTLGPTFLNRSSLRGQNIYIRGIVSESGGHFHLLGREGRTQKVQIVTLNTPEDTSFDFLSGLVLLHSSQGPIAARIVFVPRKEPMQHLSTLIGLKSAARCLKLGLPSPAMLKNDLKPGQRALQPFVE